MEKFLQKSLLLLVVFLGGCQLDPYPKEYLQYILGSGTGVKVYTVAPTTYFVINGEATSVVLYTTTSTNTLVYTEGDYKWGTYEGANFKLQLFDIHSKGGTFKLWENGVFIDEDDFSWWFGAIDLEPAFPTSIVDGAFIISDMLYLFNDDGKTLTKRTYNTSDKTYTDTEYACISYTGTSVTYKLNNEEISITDITDIGGKINNVTFKYFSLGEVDEALEGATASDLYEDSIRLDSEGSAYFLGDEMSSVSFDDYFYGTVQTIFDSTGSDTESYIANYVTNIVENYVFDSQNDVRISIDKENYPDATTITANNRIIEGDSKSSVSVNSSGRIYISDNISGTLYIEGDIVSSSHGIYIYYSSSVGDIIVNGSVGGTTGIYIYSSSSVGDIIVNGGVSGSSSDGINIYSSVENIIVNGGVSGSDGINIYSSVENIIVNGSVSGSSSSGSSYGINIHSSLEIENIIVNGGVSGRGSSGSGGSGIIIASSSVGDIIVNGGVSGSSYGIVIASSSSVENIILSGGITGGTVADNIPIYDGVKNIYTYIYYLPDMSDKYDFNVYLDK